MKIVVNFPTRSRPAKALQVLKLWQSPLVKIVATIDSDDPTMNDLEVLAQIRAMDIEVNVIAPGAIAIPCEKFRAILKECGSDALCLEVEDDKPRICRIIAPPGG